MGLFAGASPVSRVRVADKIQRVWYDDDEEDAAVTEENSQALDSQDFDVRNDN